MLGILVVMLRLSNTYVNQPVLSLRSGSRIGTLGQPIINPNNLKLEGWYTDNLNDKGDFILPVIEVRDIISKGIVVNDHTALTEPEDLVRMQETLEINFELPGKLVVTESGKRLGKVSDYAVNDENYYIQKLYVSASILRGLSQQQYTIDRSVIVELTDKKIVVPDSTIRSTSTNPSPARA